MDNKFSVFLPTRKGSQRVKNKNTRTFADINGGLLALKLSQLLKVKTINEVILSTNDEECIRVANDFTNMEVENLRIVKRPDCLALDDTNLTDLIKYVPTVCSYSNIIWTHVTSPFFEEDDYERAINSYLSSLNNGYDSLMSVKLFKNFLWDKNCKDIVNRGDSKLRWPRTQDLKELFEIDSAIFISPKNNYIENYDRVGSNPFLLKQSGFQSFDIDWEHDFDLAEAIYRNRII